MKLLNNLPKIDQAVRQFSLKNAIYYEMGDLLIFSGFAGLDLETGKLSEGNFETHANDAIDCYQYILESAGLSLDHVISVRCYLKEPVTYYPMWNEVFKARFTAPYPCRTTVGANLVVGEIELEFIAAKTTRASAELITSK
ncbi:RidA family protein [Paraburkholderia aromaticivorans]|nr:RidA family protein [Paraburkholderia aromaticivorans]